MVLWRARAELPPTAFRSNARPGIVAHLRWFQNALNDEARQLFIGEVEELPIGYVRLDYEASCYWSSIALLPDYRGRGLGSEFLSAVLAQLEVDTSVRAHVHTSNEASKRLFLGVGFRQVAIDGDFVVMALIDE